jgi:beta-galactosidase
MESKMKTRTPEWFRKLTAPGLLVLILATAAAASRAKDSAASNFNPGWQFSRETPQPGVPVSDWKWMPAQAGKSYGDIEREIPADDAPGWRNIHLGEDLFGGKPGIGWLRAVLPASASSDSVVRFSGDDRGLGTVEDDRKLARGIKLLEGSSTVFLNGTRIAFQSGNRMIFDAALGNAWKEHGPNVLTVLVECIRPGGGIPKSVSLVKPVEPREMEPGFDDSKWETVSVPHTDRLEAWDQYFPFQGISWNRKVFTPESSMKGRRVSLEFQGAFQVADVWVNGRHKLTHFGGFLPFTVDLSEESQVGKPVVVAVRVDSRDNELVPPGKPLGSVDFEYYSGIYRNVILHTTAPLHITDAIVADKPGGGGLFVTYPSVSRETATVQVQTEVKNDSDGGRAACVTCELIDAADQIVASSNSETVSIAAAADQTFTQKMEVKNPALWHPDHPNLYRLNVAVVEGASVIDRQEIKIGIRRFTVDHEKGFVINGDPLMLTGANKHQFYPWIGSALSDNAHYRDLRKLKEAGFNFVRLAHYPMAPAVMDACDELGLIAIVCVPGWQHWDNRPVFNERVARAEREMVRWHRNHPSAIFWEVTLNETYSPIPQLKEWIKAVREEYPGDQMLTCGDTKDYGDPPGLLDVPYPGWQQASLPADRAIAYDGPKNGDWRQKRIWREYGDGTPASRLLRGDGEARMLTQAWRLQSWTNQQLGQPYTLGMCIWHFFDHLRGYAPDFSACGLVSQDRLPKFAYNFFQSQRDPASRRTDIASGPMVFIANYWKQDSPRPLMVYSNCDEVELFVNGKSAARQKPDHGPDTPEGEKLIPGGDVSRLAHPQFTFNDVAFVPGELKAVGIIGGKPAATAIRLTPGAPAKLAIKVDFSGRDLVADGADSVFVWAEVQDANGTVVPDAKTPVHFKVGGDALLAGEEVRAAEAGIASNLIRAGTKPGPITISASADGLTAATIILDAK